MASIRHYLGQARVPGRPATLLTVVVKVLRESGDGPALGYVQTTYFYVQTTYFTGRIPTRLHLRWSRVS